MTYPLLKKAPKDHNSEEFLQFLRDNNKVISETRVWLVIENCKYNAPERRWYTAFFKLNGLPQRTHIGKLFLDTPYGWSLMMKEPGKRTIERPHIHIYES